MQIFVALVLLVVQSGNPSIDEDAEGQQILVFVGVLAQGDRIPPEFSEQAEEKLKAMPPTALPHLLRLINQLNPEMKLRLDQCGREIIQRAKEESREVPESYLQKFAASDRQDATARHVALGWLELRAPGAKEQFLLEHLRDDAFRRDSIDVCLNKAGMLGNNRKDESIQMLTRAFSEVRDLDQAKQLTAALAKQGIAVSPEKQLGVVDQWSCESTLKSSVAVQARAIDPVLTGDSNAVRLERTPSNFFTCVVAKRPQRDCRFVLRTVIQSDAERDVQIRITCNRSPRFHVNGEEISLIKSTSAFCGGEGLSEFSKPFHLLRGSNEAAFKFEESESHEGQDSDNDSADIRFCIRIVDDLGKGLHEPQVISERAKDPADSPGQP